MDCAQDEVTSGNICQTSAAHMTENVDKKYALSSHSAICRNAGAPVVYCDIAIAIAAGRARDLAAATAAAATYESDIDLFSLVSNGNLRILN